MILSTKVVLSGASALGLGVLATVSEVPLDKLLSGGAAGMAGFMCWLFLRHQKEMRQEHNQTIERVTDRFSTTVKEVSDKHNETTQIILRDSRDREMQLHNLLREERNKQ